MFRDLTNEHTRRVSAFVDKIKTSTGVKYNLAWTYGGYLVDVPARLGTNEALDRAADTVLAALERFSASHVDVTPVILEKYTLALAALRRCLDDPVKAKASETLCAVLLLLTCQVRIFGPISLSSLINGRHFCGRLQGLLRVIRKGRPRLLDFEDVLVIVTSSKVTCCLHFVELWQVIA